MNFRLSEINSLQISGKISIGVKISVLLRQRQRSIGNLLTEEKAATKQPFVSDCLNRVLYSDCNL